MTLNLEHQSGMTLSQVSDHNPLAAYLNDIRFQTLLLEFGNLHSPLELPKPKPKQQSTMCYWSFPKDRTQS